MRNKGRRLVIVLFVVAALVTAACGTGGDGGPAPTGQGKIQQGGIWNAEAEDFGFVGGFDPTGEYLGTAWAYFSNLLVRTLVTYPHQAGAAGAELVPDLAEDLPEVSDDGLTYTFTLKDGIEFGPPVSREITSADIEYAFRRIATESAVAQYANYYEGEIEGLKVGKDPGPGGISGIETPDDKTVVFHLTEPTGDFLYRLAMPATGPIPEEVANCFTEAGEYGRYVIASGPYMIEGSDELDISSCNSMEPLSGFNPNRHLHFVRNENYDPATDDTRPAYLDGVSIDINTNTEDIYNKIEAGELDGEVASGNPPGDVLQAFSNDDELSDQVTSTGGDRTWYITMNLAVPPFDDIHVRKAANLVMDKDGIRRAWGGPIQGEIATHIVPPEMTGGSPSGEEYDPYPSENFAGDVEAAKEEMSQSKYDTDQDGICDAPECDNILMINRNVPPWTDMEPVIVQSLEKIGLGIQPRQLEVDASYTTVQTVAKAVPLGANVGWGKDYPDALTFVGFLFDSDINCTGNYNYSLIGVATDQLQECKLPTLPGGDIPGVDDQIVECSRLGGQERVDCWIELDKTLMEDVVPWIPYLWANAVTVYGSDVTNFEWDQFAAEPAFSRLAVDPASDK